MASITHRIETCLCFSSSPSSSSSSSSSKLSNNNINTNNVIIRKQRRKIGALLRVHRRTITATKTRFNNNATTKVRSLLNDREERTLWDELIEAEDGGYDNKSSETPLWEMLAEDDDDFDEREKKTTTAKKKKKSSLGAKKSSSSPALDTDSATISNSALSKTTTSTTTMKKKKEVEEEKDNNNTSNTSVEDSAALELFRDTTRDALRISKSDFTVSSIIDKINRGKVDLRPSYQREYVWTVRTASKLIESLLLNIPVPTMFFHEVKSGKLEVVDGKQRLTSIWSFVQNEFPGGQAFKLSGLEVYHELNGKTFNELNETFQEIILDYPLNVHTISKTSQPDFVFEVFERLNMGATQLNEQELRNCIYQGAYTDLLEALALNESFLIANRSKMPHLRMRDRELILRFFAMLRTTPSGFYLPAKSWLNEEMRENKDLLPGEANDLAMRFEKTLKLCVDIFGDCAFRAPKLTKKEVTAADVKGIFVREYFESGEISVALWDTIMGSFVKMATNESAYQLAIDKKDEIVAAWINLACSDKFRRNLVSQPKAVVARNKMFQDMLNDLGFKSYEDDDDEDVEIVGPR